MVNNTYYSILAMLYDKQLKNGFLNCEELSIPLEFTTINLSPEINNLLKNSGDSIDFLKTIGKIINTFSLNKDFCTLIKNSPTLRYMLCNYFHDAIIERSFVFENNFKMQMDISGSFGKPILNNKFLTRIELNFIDVENLDNYKQKILNHYNYVDHKIEYDGKLIFYIKLCKGNKNPEYEYLTIKCENIILL